jgi:CRP-like cAMP-binding protein
VLQKVSPYKGTIIGSFGSGIFIGVLILLDAPYERVKVGILEQSHLFRIKKETFWQMIFICPSVTQEILRTMAQRIKLV